MKITSSLLFVLGFTALAASYSTVRAQVPASVLDGVYTDAQATRVAPRSTKNRVSLAMARS
jgi:hypothetical protein